MPPPLRRIWFAPPSCPYVDLISLLNPSLPTPLVPVMTRPASTRRDTEAKPPILGRQRPISARPIAAGRPQWRSPRPPLQRLLTLCTSALLRSLSLARLGSHDSSGSVVYPATPDARLLPTPSWTSPSQPLLRPPLASYSTKTPRSKLQLPTSPNILLTYSHSLQPQRLGTSTPSATRPADTSNSVVLNP